MITTGETLTSRAAIAARCVVLRRLHAANQAEFCRMVQIGQSTWNQFEKGTNRPSLEIALQLRRKLGVSLDWLYTGDVAGLSRGLASDLLRESNPRE